MAPVKRNQEKIEEVLMQDEMRMTVDDDSW